MPIRKPRASNLDAAVRHQARRIAEAMFADRHPVSIHAVLASDDDHPMAPVESNALRVVIDGWAASLHRTAIPVLVHLDGDGRRDLAKALEGQLQAALNSQVTRAVDAHRARVPAPLPHDPFRTDGQGPPVAVDHLDGQQLEIDHMLAVGGAAMVRRVYGTIARDILLRRAAGVSAAHHAGTLVGTEISARIAIGERAELHRSTLIVTDVIPDTVVEAVRGGPLDLLVDVAGIGGCLVHDVKRHRGNPSSQGLKRRDHTRIEMSYAYKQGLRWRLERHEMEEGE